VSEPRWHVPWLAFGGDYNPEQWPRAVWRDDLRSMVEGGDVLGGLHHAGIAVGLYRDPRRGAHTWDLARWPAGRTARWGRGDS
jgi:Ser/Thr protein kinase RdoA (MazF antagonist)